MNKQLILNLLRKELEKQEFCLEYDKALAAALWDRCDKNRPVSTERYYLNYKSTKNRIRATKVKLKSIRDTIKVMKTLTIICIEDFTND
jgi:hypothetical protein